MSAEELTRQSLPNCDTLAQAFAFTRTRLSDARAALAAHRGGVVLADGGTRLCVVGFVVARAEPPECEGDLVAGTVTLYGRDDPFVKEAAGELRDGLCVGHANLAAVLFVYVAQGGEEPSRLVALLEHVDDGGRQHVWSGAIDAHGATEAFERDEPLVIERRVARLSRPWWARIGPLLPDDLLTVGKDTP